MNATLRRLQKRAHGDRGFTLIELLVVVVIIGVLVAIAIPVYMNYREGAADKSAQSDVRGAITAVESYYTVNGNKYPDGLAAPAKGVFTLGSGSTAQKVSISAGTELNYLKVSNTDYLICATNGTGSGAVYVYDNTKGGSVEAVTNAKIATCKA
ncbi:prepilin-type N-terminal cleavage/methylation domain-containing protein [Planomonospora sp. ID67723]|uniref:type II secretion system protein n=1 Tax=Planomonospora sp. ID67723 TaxID=2738134 RepID=UPI0018C41611|nr:prepilin-type N-terminal cleavage/methylation domain-containing protein [Planomonospora sp. ID67723]MBG0830672.1 prepilin-type N-terminal cleavage/methylation domain-containing protein [Planomonospora sp. ID67723]